MPKTNKLKGDRRNLYFRDALLLAWCDKEAKLEKKSFSGFVCDLIKNEQQRRNRRNR